MANASILAAFERMWLHITNALNNKSDTVHNHDSSYDAKGAADAALLAAQEYADGVKNDLLNGAGEAYDTLKELGDLIDENTDALDALNAVATGKADKEHMHMIGDVTNLQTTLDNLSDKQDKITGAAGDFVVIGEDGHVTTKTIANASEVKF